MEPTSTRSDSCAGIEYQKPLSTAKVGTSGTTRAAGRLRDLPPL